MKNKISIDIDNMLSFVTKQDFDAYVSKAVVACNILKEENGAGSDFLGWKTLPSSITMEEIKNIKRCAAKLTEKCEVVVVVGVGGSYIGAKAIVEALTNRFAANISEKRPTIVWAGNNLSGDFAFELKEMLQTKEIGMIVISKSGTTLESALAFRFVKKIIEDKYGRTDAASRIVAITDKTQGSLRQVTQTEGYTSFVIPENVGGRFSVLTPVGLLPIALAGIDIEALMEGAYYIEDKFTSDDLNSTNNSVLTYVAVRNLLYNQGKKVELFASFEPKLFALGEWWKQLFGESEGKGSRGIFPTCVMYSSDLHSIGQYVQDGERFLMETFIEVDKYDNDVVIRKDKDDLDGLNFLAGKTVGEINKLAQKGVAVAHTDGGVPNITISIPKLDAENIGALIYFFEVSCAVSAYMLGVNPFDQDGVEEYKKNIFALIDRPGYEEIAEKLKLRLKR